MPIIKDKYGAKGSRTRSNFVTRKNNPAIEQETPTGISTAQKEEINKQNYRASAAGQKTSSIVPVESILLDKDNFKINYKSISAANTVTQLFKLNKGDSLQDIVIHNYHSTASSDANNTISIYWSAGEQVNGTFTVSNGLITAFSGINMVRLFGSQFPYLGTVNLREALINAFQHISKDIYFYGVARYEGPDVTFSKTSG